MHTYERVFYLNLSFAIKYLVNNIKEFNLISVQINNSESKLQNYYQQ